VSRIDISRRAIVLDRFNNKIQLLLFSLSREFAGGV
jgi:hypothetical protein